MIHFAVSPFAPGSLASDDHIRGGYFFVRLRWWKLAVVCGAICIASFAGAIGNAEYLAARAKTNLLNLVGPAHIANLLAGKRTQVIEVQGIVNGVFSSEDMTGFILRLDASQTLVFNSRYKDGDITIGKALRVLAQIPSDGDTLECIAVTPATPDTPSTPAQRITTPAMSRTAKPAMSPRPAAPAPPSVTPDTPAPVTPTPSTDTPPVEVAPEQTDSSVPLVPVESAEQPDAPPPPPISQAQPTTDHAVIAHIYADRIQQINPNVTAETAGKIATQMLEKAIMYSLDPRLLFALVAQESRFNPHAVSCKGARGLGQLMPGTAYLLGVTNCFDIEQNLDGCARYLREQIDSFGLGPLALAAYNAGPKNVKKFGGIPPFRETKRYAHIVWRNFCALSSRDPETGEVIAAK